MTDMTSDTPTADTPVSHRMSTATTLFDLIAGLQDQAPDEADGFITDTVTRLCQARWLRWLRPSEDDDGLCSERAPEWRGNHGDRLSRRSAAGIG